MRMEKKKRKYEMDMIHGAILPKMLVFTLPLMFTSMLQLLYNAADVIVVGRFVGKESLAAVGSTGPLINLIINLFIGMSVGTNVVAARYYGARDFQGTQDTVHTSILLSLIFGVGVGIFGYVFGGTFLKWMGSPDDVLPLATTYIKIYFIGMPVNLLYNFGAAVLRAVGDTRRPLIILSVSGIINVGLNLFFVINVGMGVAGVAWATIISQAVSAILVMLCLIRTEGYVHLDVRKLRIQAEKFREVMRLGLPAGFQSVCFSISNVLIQSTVNAYGAVVVAGNSASQNIEGFIYVGMNSFCQAAITFASANKGAGKNRRIRETLASSLILVLAVGTLLCAIAYILRPQLINIYSPDPEVIAAGVRRLTVFGLTYMLCGCMDVTCGVLRGMGASITPMVVSIIGACAFRIFWIYAILPLAPGFGFDPLETLYYSYPISWVLTGGVHLICYAILIRKFPMEPKAELSD